MVRDKRILRNRFVATLLTGLILTPILTAPTADPLADPLIKPKKYHGPIPRKSLTLAFGFFAGAENEEFWAYLDQLVDQALRNETNTEDFGPAPQLDLIFTNKLHPNFALRARGGAAWLTSGSTGREVRNDSVLVSFDRNFDVTLLSLEGSALYYFQDASVKEFQVFLGGGLGFYFPYQQWSETTIDESTGQEHSSETKNEWSVEPGIHFVLGMLYHFGNTWAITAEGRGQIAQSKFTLELPTASDGVQPLNFDVDYTGFSLTVGVARFF